MEKKTRTLLELYKLLLDYFKKEIQVSNEYLPKGLCICLAEMRNDNMINIDERRRLRDDMWNRRPPNALAFWWHPRDRKSRQEFLEGIIQELKKNRRKINDFNGVF